MKAIESITIFYGSTRQFLCEVSVKMFPWIWQQMTLECKINRELDYKI